MTPHNIPHATGSAANMVGMAAYNESLHPRGNPGNADQFRQKHNSAPSGGLRGDSELPSERIERLEGQESRWRERAEATAAFRSAHGGRFPSRSSRDSTGKSLGIWREKQIAALRTGKLSSERIEFLDRVLPGWRPMDKESRFRDRAEATAAFRGAHGGRFPSKRADDSTENSLWVWRQNQFSALRTGKLSAERIEFLDRVLPGWRPMDKESRFRDNAEATAAFRGTHGGRFPSKRADDPEERNLGVWKQGQIAALRTGKLSAERAGYLDRVLPGWRPKDQESDWRNQAEATAEFMTAHDGRFPSARSTDSKERSLGA